jgi:hypothetical protein
MAVNKDAVKLAAKHTLIRRGQIDWLLHRGQKELTEFFDHNKARISVFNCPRRFGKSYWIVWLAIRHAIKNPGSQIRVAAPTQKQIRSIFVPLVDQILAQFPIEIQPEHANGTWAFTNGSKVILAGADYKEGDALRGVASDLILVDEAGFTKNLGYLVQDILLPQTITTNGRVVLASTPPKSMDHDFSNTYIRRAVADNAYLKRTIFDNPMITEAKRAEIIIECGGEDTDTWKREYMCELISDSSALIIPEFRADIHIQKHPVPHFFRPYVGADFGLKDFTAVLFGYFDFNRQVLVIQDEFIANYQTVQQIGDGIKRIENELWPKHNLEPIRVGDNELQTLWDLARVHGIHIKPAMKLDKETAISSLRTGIQSNKIEIWPNCKNLIHQLQNGTWNDRRTTFERSETTGHCDAIDALIYLYRHLKRRENPFPVQTYSHQTHFVPKEKPDIGEWGKIFKLKGTK